MFQKARPIWLEGLSKEQNCFVSFTCEALDLRGTSLHVAAATFYRLLVNGQLVAFGPARTAKGYAREDIIPLSEYHREGGSLIQLEVAGYNCRSLSTVKQDSFLMAELRRGDEALAYSGRDFIGRRMYEKEQFTERYSGQRHFGEVWNDLAPAPAVEIPTVTLDAAVKIIDRVAPYPSYEEICLKKAAAFGRFAYDSTLPYREKRSSFPIDEYWGCFPDELIFFHPYRWIQQQSMTAEAADAALPLSLSAGQYALFDFGRIECGFLRFAAEIADSADVVIGFSEYCEGNRFSFTEMNVQNVLEYVLAPGHAQRLSFEPYTMRFAVILVKSGHLILHDFGMTAFMHDTARAYRPEESDQKHRALYEAALRTLAHNAVDLFSDCPSRERAGWLCDSYFTGEAEHFFFGESPVEEAFLENFLLYDTASGELPRGVLPMCYPSDIKALDRAGVDARVEFIPQWNLWYILEVEDFLTKRGGRIPKERFRHSVEGILTFFGEYENELGLLERLPSWNFVEWSSANDWTQDVNYPTNFLYAAALSTAARLFGVEKWEEKAEKIRKATLTFSFDGKLFVDNAVRVDGVLCNTGNASEAGQYYAILFGGLDWQDPRYDTLRAFVRGGFPAEEIRRERCFVPVNAFIGLYLRIKALLQLEEYQLLIDEVDGFFGDMIAKTGTLWEYRQPKGSFDHGFAAFAAPALFKAIENVKK
ncbi:MAG: hypothetical protein E7644_06065 [Ruminococcaceae bacterium]|nr:hypothetical protein [Oscillospiraceae bacterium]